VTTSTSQVAAEAADFDPRPVGVLHPVGAISAPSVGEVEALGPLVAAQDPEDRFGIADLCETAAGLRKQPTTDPTVPVLRIDVEGVDLPGALRVGVASRAEGGEADDPLAGEGDERLRVGGGGGVEVVPPDSLLRLQRVEDAVVDQAPVGDLPGTDVDAGDVKTLVRPGGSDYEVWRPFGSGILKQSCDEETLMPVSPDSTMRAALREAMSPSSCRVRSCSSRASCKPP
jgi:hypothetical protein